MSAPPPKRVAIVQSSYIPWKGYFDLIASVDEFIFLDDVQFTKRDWRSRNRIMTARGPEWLTIPVVSKGRYRQPIDRTEIADPWARSHWAALRSNYARAPYFDGFAPAVEALYDSAAGEHLLSDVNRLLIGGICAMLEIGTKRSNARDYGAEGRKTDRLLSLCRAAGATEYLSGPSAAAYLDTGKFAAAGISVRYADYSGYPEYRQLHGPFEHGVTILDLLFNTGPDARAFMKNLAP
jgi:hypothetical protein